MPFCSFNAATPTPTPTPTPTNTNSTQGYGYNANNYHSWYQNDELHRGGDLPAIIRADGSQACYQCGTNNGANPDLQPFFVS